MAHRVEAAAVRQHLFRTHLLKAEELWSEGWELTEVALCDLLAGTDFRGIIFGSREVHRLSDFVDHLQTAQRDDLTMQELDILDAMPGTPDPPAILVVKTDEGMVVLDGKLRALRSLWRGEETVPAYVKAGR